MSNSRCQIWNSPARSFLPEFSRAILAWHKRDWRWSEPSLGSLIATMQSRAP